MDLPDEYIGMCEKIGVHFEEGASLENEGGQNDLS